ncbi:MAG: M48 family metallopeptidase [Bacteroidia bacterium]|nr:M48 family metallopeptidase [Bacteroidia bacterium]
MSKLSLIWMVMAATALMALSCARVPFTNRRQARLLPETTMNTMSFAQYKEFLGQNPPSKDTKNTQLVRDVGNRIRQAAELYYKAKGLGKQLEGFAWEFNLVEDKTVNAWCMPGGKVVVYTGILPIARDADGLAVVMGHEIAHALAHHGNERMSQQLAIQLGGVGLDVAMSQKPEQTRQIFQAAYGVGAQVGAILPFSRLHESEADKIGLFLMAIAGYDLNAAAPFWERMQAGGGSTPPEFMSTHPSPETRAENLRAWIPEARALAQQYKLP